MKKIKRIKRIKPNKSISQSDFEKMIDILNKRHRENFIVGGKPLLNKNQLALFRKWCGLK